MVTEKNPNNLDQRFSNEVSLRTRLLTFVLPIVLAPLMVSSLIGEQIIERKTKASVYSELQSDTLLTAKTAKYFIRQGRDLSKLLTKDNRIIDLVTAGNKKMADEQLDRLSIEELEQKFAASKLLISDPEVDTFLQNIVDETNAHHVVVTQKDGLGVAYTVTDPDLVQRDEAWWQEAQTGEVFISDPKYHDWIDADVIPIYKTINDPQTQEFLGVVKANMSLSALEIAIDANLSSFGKKPYKFQIVNSSNGRVFDNVESQEELANKQSIDIESQAFHGDENILQLAQTLSQAANQQTDLAALQQSTEQQPKYSEVIIQEETMFSLKSVTALVRYQDKVYSFSTIPDTNLVAVGAFDYAVVTALGRELVTSFALIGIALGTVATGLTVLFARRLSEPLVVLSETTRRSAAGDLSLKANVVGTKETKILAHNFNQLITQVQNSITNQQEIAEKQFQEKEKLEEAIYELIDEISEAIDGDLTVRASLDSLELSTVADLFNAIVDNLEDIAVETRNSSSAVGSALQENEMAIRALAEQAIAEVAETRSTLISVEEMAASIQEVAQNAKEAEQITDDAYHEVLQSTENMNLTVNSILALRDTVGETENKMKRLGESSQQIAQALTLIEEISLKTNVLAINASAEAERAGEYGQGFTVVAEQVGSLAKQSAAATREISRIITTIQTETAEVSEAMKSGTIQVTDSTELVRSTKNSLAQVLKKSQEITQLMSSISATTISQANTSQSVTNLMQKIAELSEMTSQSSEKVAKSIGDTALVAQKLESTVAQFKVSEG